MPLVSSRESALLEHLCGVTALTFESLWLALSTTEPTVAGGNFTEPGDTGYARQELSTLPFVVSGAAPAVFSNDTLIDFGTAEGSAWGEIVAFGFFNASSSGDLVLYGAITPSQDVGPADTVRFPIDAIAVRLGDTTF